MTTYTAPNRSARPPRVRERPPGSFSKRPDEGAFDDVFDGDADVLPTRIERTIDGETRTFVLVDERALRRVARRAAECGAQADLLATRLTTGGPDRVVEMTATSALRRQLRALHDAIVDLMR